MRITKFRTILMLLLIICAPPSIFAQFEDLGVGARGTGLNNAFIGLADDVYTIYYNPAGLARITWKEIGLDYDKLYWGLDDNSSLGNGFVAYVHSLDRWGTVGIGWLNFALSTYYSEDTFMLAYGRQIKYSADGLPDSLKSILGPFGTGALRAGLKLKALSKGYGKTRYTENATNLDAGRDRGDRDPVFNNGYSRKGFSLDLGLLYDIGPRHSIGLTLNDINQPNMGLDIEDRIYFGTKFGYAYKGKNFNMMIDFIFKREDITFCSGVEKWFIGKTFGLRGGLAVGSRNYANLSLGGSWRYNDLFQFDYSFRYPLTGISSIYGSHQLSLTLRFGLPEIKEIDLESELQRLKLELENAKKLAEEYKHQVKQLMKTKDERNKIVRETQEKQQQAELKLQQVQEELKRVNAEMKTKVSEEGKKKALKGYWYSAMSYYNKGEYEKAIAEFQKILELEPTHSGVEIGIKMAKEKLQEKIKSDVEKHYTLGVKAYHEGSLKVAVEELEAALNLDPKNKEIRTLLERAKKEIQLKEKR